MLAGLKFQTKTSDRWSEQLTPWGVLDMALRGNRAQWWELYAMARRDPELRGLLRKMLPLADPELCGGKRLWLALLDRFDADGIGLRQLRRAEPLDAALVDGLWVPTLPELIRVKSFVLSDRRAVRDFIDVCALIRTAGMEQALTAMETFDPLYAGLCAAGPLTAFAEAAHDDPADAAEVDLGSWRLLDSAYANLPVVLACVREFALLALERAARRQGIDGP